MPVPKSMSPLAAAGGRQTVSPPTSAHYSQPHYRSTHSLEYNYPHTDHQRLPVNTVGQPRPETDPLNHNHYQRWLQDPSQDWIPDEMLGTNLVQEFYTSTKRHSLTNESFSLWGGEYACNGVQNSMDLCLPAGLSMESQLPLHAEPKIDIEPTRACHEQPPSYPSNGPPPLDMQMTDSLERTWPDSMTLDVSQESARFNAECARGPETWSGANPKLKLQITTGTARSTLHPERMRWESPSLSERPSSPSQHVDCAEAFTSISAPNLSPIDPPTQPMYIQEPAPFLPSSASVPIPITPGMLMQMDAEATEMAMKMSAQEIAASVPPHPYISSDVASQSNLFPSPSHSPPEPFPPTPANMVSIAYPASSNSSSVTPLYSTQYDPPLATTIQHPGNFFSPKTQLTPFNAISPLSRDMPPRVLPKPLILSPQPSPMPDPMSMAKMGGASGYPGISMRNSRDSGYGALFHGQSLPNTMSREMSKSGGSTSNMESRRSNHKVNEQRRRNILRQNFESLREAIPESYIPRENGAVVSKITLVRKAKEYILQLQKDTSEQTQQIKELEMKMEEMRRFVLLQEGGDSTEVNP
ncbi:uncharacterized protein VTP21DRAFT_9290 [Calcarisporiella thermophila]|uniref:uncharacterized protein n=1 Tax=Calcarisporiella thermophila TaxID=911321 RepID=UPI0037425EC1